MHTPLKERVALLTNPVCLLVIPRSESEVYVHKKKKNQMTR